MTDWYQHQDELDVGDVFSDADGDLVRLDRRVPGDGTDWYVEDWVGGSWAAYDRRIHPSDLKDRSNAPS